MENSNPDDESKLNNLTTISSWLQKSSINILNNYNSSHILQLSGDHIAELNMQKDLPPPPTPPSSLPNPLGYTTKPILRKNDTVTSIGILVNRYPIIKRKSLKDPKESSKIVQTVLTKRMVRSFGGEETLPSPRIAIVINKGKDSLSFIYDGALEVYLNNDRITWLVLSDKGNLWFNQLHQEINNWSETVPWPNQQKSSKFVSLPP